MRKNDNFYSIISGLLVAALVVGFFFTLKNFNSLEKQISRQEMQVVEISQYLNNIEDVLDTVFTELQQEKLKRLSLEKKTENILGEIDSFGTNGGSQDISKIVENWESRIAKVDCRSLNSFGSIVESSGSAIATYMDSSPYFITNRHVVLRDDRSLIECQIKLGEDVFKIDSLNISAVPGGDGSHDLAYIRPNASSFSKVKTETNICETKPLVGDSVVVLGYPSVGSSEGVTVTEGIISGFDKGYYITSAKIERGNSGGAAISMEDDCLLGLPTLVFAGRIESLARILPL